MAGVRSLSFLAAIAAVLLVLAPAQASADWRRHGGVGGRGPGFAPLIFGLGAILTAGAAYGAYNRYGATDDPYDADGMAPHRCRAFSIPLYDQFGQHVANTVKTVCH